MRQFSFLLCLSFLCIAGVGDVFAQGLGRIVVDQPFPDLALPSLQDGSPLSVARYRGQKVVLHIWASW